jgi:hypothetical protein
MDRRKLLKSALSSAVGLGLLAGMPKANGAQIASAPDASLHARALPCDFIETADGVRIGLRIARNQGWRDLRCEATRAHDSRTANYLIGTPMMAEYLEEALSQFGLSFEDFAQPL